MADVEGGERVPEAIEVQNLLGIQDITVNGVPAPQVVFSPKGRSMYEVINGRAFIRVNTEDRAHWAEAIAHEMGHWACRHVTPPNGQEMYRQELEAWEWAMKKGLKFDRKFVEECLFTHALELQEAQAVVEAMVRGDNLITQYRQNWKITP